MWSGGSGSHIQPAKCGADGQGLCSQQPSVQPCCGPEEEEETQRPGGGYQIFGGVSLYGLLGVWSLWLERGEGGGGGWKEGGRGRGKGERGGGGWKEGGRGRGERGGGGWKEGEEDGKRGEEGGGGKREGEGREGKMGSLVAMETKKNNRIFYLFCVHFFNFWFLLRFQLGHVPNSVNLPNNETFMADGSFSPSPAVSTLLESKGKTLVIVSGRGEGGAKVLRGVVHHLGGVVHQGRWFAILFLHPSFSLQDS